MHTHAHAHTHTKHTEMYTRTRTRTRTHTQHTHTHTHTHTRTHADGYMHKRLKRPIREQLWELQLLAPVKGCRVSQMPVIECYFRFCDSMHLVRTCCGVCVVCVCICCTYACACVFAEQKRKTDPVSRDSLYGSLAWVESLQETVSLRESFSFRDRDPLMMMIAFITFNSSFEQIELQAKLLNYFLGSKKSNINNSILV